MTETRPPTPSRARAGMLSAVLVTALLASCAQVNFPVAADPTTEAAVLDRLYFGRNIGDTGQVSDADWRAFLAEIVTPRFPAGLTAWPAQGQWRGESGVIVHEDSFVLELLHPGGADDEAAIEEIAEAYKRRFDQEAVLRIRSPVRASF